MAGDLDLAAAAILIVLEGILGTFGGGGGEAGDLNTGSFFEDGSGGDFTRSRESDDKTNHCGRVMGYRRTHRQEGRGKEEQ